MEWKLSLVGGKTYQLNLDPRQGITPTLNAHAAQGNLVVNAKLCGAGTHVLKLAVFNLGDPAINRQVTLKGGDESILEWRLEVIDKSKPRIAVAIPITAPDLRQEVFVRSGS